MKYLKKFNEELKPETYKTAGSRLINYHGQHERGSRLSQYGHELAGDLIGMWVGESANRTSFHLPLEFHFTECRLKLPNHESFYLNNSDYWLNKISDALGELVQLYKEGGNELYFDIELFFQLSPRHKNLMGKLWEDIQRRKKSGQDTGLNDDFIIKSLSSSGTIQLMTLRVYMSEHLIWEDEDGNQIKPSEEEIYDGFESMFYPSVYFIKPTCLREYVGTPTHKLHQILAIPCSRAEANKMRSKVMTQVADKLKPVIHELFSEHIQGKPEHYEKVISTISNMKTNDMYRDKIEYKHDTSSFLRQFARNYN